ncbi:MAG: PilZ domain-containing protein [Pyrinomonadaceae bacterium]
MSEKDPRGKTNSSQRPRSPRVPVEFALEVEGSDSDGNPFRVKAQAIKISRGGATIVLDVDMAVGTIVQLVPPFGQKLEAQVNGAWTDSITQRKYIGVKLLGEDGWFAG